MCTSKRLAAIKGISDAKVEKMKEAARKLDGHEFVTGFEYAEQRKEFLKTLWLQNGPVNTVSESLKIVQFIFETEKAIFRISTGSEEFDRILGGGFESMAITGLESHKIPTKQLPQI